MNYELKKDDFVISTNKAKLDIQLIHTFLSKESYWAKDIPKHVVERSIEGSVCFGIYNNDQQVGFARVITDMATVAYLGDVFILEKFRGSGLSKWLMESIVQHPDLQGLRRWILLTRDAHRLYEKVGFKSLSNPDRYMELHNPNVYSI
jgi:GNAT superfamily N-acetyltransferase